MKVLGIMSGTSMDGADLALCHVHHDGVEWKAEVLKAVTYNYDEKWRVRLSQLRYQYAEIYVKTDIFYGRYLGELVNRFCQETGEKPDLVASHGHTIFHQPDVKMTSQIGDGATLNAVCGIPVVSNFRRADVALGGQGAPLAGLGDELLFPDYDVCLNLGGFSNISADMAGRRIAFDVSPCNIVLNRVARELGHAYDSEGQIAESGEIIYPMLKRLNEIQFYSQSGPKSLGREWINKEFWHVVRDFDQEPAADRMKTLVVHIAQQVAASIKNVRNGNEAGSKVLATGGGAHNLCLIDHLKNETDAEIIVPDKGIVDYKEALIFALLGAMRVKNATNTLHTATGARKAWVSGSLDGDFSNLI
jgi:anhydro-N-acetylmuramic acid kinase